MSMIESVEFNYLKNILVPQRMYLGYKENAKILIKKFVSLKNNICAASYGTYNQITVTNKTHGQNGVGYMSWNGCV
jgi:hypothetical protein